jgi:hypothetical protein
MVGSVLFALPAGQETEGEGSNADQGDQEQV